jgi:hypothetical protein
MSRRLFERGDMHDQRIEARPVLGGKDLGHGLVLRRIGAETVDGLGRKGDELPFDQRFDGFGDGLGQAAFLSCD